MWQKCFSWRNLISERGERLGSLRGLEEISITNISARNLNLRTQEITFIWKLGIVQEVVKQPEDPLPPINDIKNNWGK